MTRFVSAKKGNMRKLIMWNVLTLDGYFEGSTSWALNWHNEVWGGELERFSLEQLRTADLLLFGRVTYELMAGYWPTPDAIASDPIVARGMNTAMKIVFSRTLDKADWSNTRLVKGDPVTEVRRLKQEPGSDLTVLGSGSIVSQLAQAGLVDLYQILLNPVVIGTGKTMFEGVSGRHLAGGVQAAFDGSVSYVKLVQWHQDMTSTAAPCGFPFAIPMLQSAIEPVRSLENNSRLPSGDCMAPIQSACLPLNNGRVRPLRSA